MPTTDLKAIELRLEALLEPYRTHLEETTIDSMPVLRRKGAKKRDWFAGVRPVDDAVELSFLPMREHPDLLEDISGDLRGHKAGAAVFRFTEMDEHVAGALEDLLARGFLRYMEK